MSPFDDKVSCVSCGLVVNERDSVSIVVDPDEPPMPNCVGCAADKMGCPEQLFRMRRDILRRRRANLN